MKAIIATTHIDRQHEKLALSALEGLVKQMHGRVLPVNIEHDPRKPPVGVMHNASLVELDDSEYGVEVESLIWESADDLAEVEALGLTYNPNMPKSGNVSLILDYSYYDDEEQRNDAKEFCKAHGLDFNLYGKKAVDPISQLTIAAGCFIAGAIASGFLGAIGSDAYAALKKRVCRMLNNNPTTGDKLVVFRFRIDDGGHEYVLEVLLENPGEEDVEWFMTTGVKAVDSIASRLTPRHDRTKMIMITAADQKLHVSYGINENGLPLNFREVSDSESEQP